MPESSSQNYWDREIAKWREHSIPEPVKSKVLEAISYLRAELGEDFLINAIIPNPGLILPWPTHPIVNMLAFISDWNIDLLIALSEQLSEVKAHSTNYEKILDKLKDREQCLEGFSILKSAYRFSKVGFDIAIEPTISNKTPDLIIKDRENSTELLVEVTIVDRPAVFEASVENSTILGRYFQESGRGLAADITFYKLYSKAHLDEILNNDIKNVVNEVKNSNTSKTITINGGMAITISPSNNPNGGGLLSSSGPRYEINYITRLMQRIEDKQKNYKQINNYPKIIILQSNFMEIKDPELFINVLEEDIYDFTDLAYVMVVNEYLADERTEARETYGDHRYIKRFKNMQNEKDVILVNRFCTLQIPASTKHKIYTSYE